MLSDGETVKLFSPAGDLWFATADQYPNHLMAFSIDFHPGNFFFLSYLVPPCLVLMSTLRLGGSLNATRL